MAASKLVTGAALQHHAPRFPLPCLSSLHRFAVVGMQVISVEMPNTVELEVVETDPGVKGNTAGVSGWVGGGPSPARRGEAMEGEPRGRHALELSCTVGWPHLVV